MADRQYIALLNDDKGNGPLKQYFLGETMHGADAGILYVPIFERPSHTLTPSAANMYLAEGKPFFNSGRVS